jgi:hypothetical protein
MLGVSDDGERVLHAPASAVARSGEVIVIRSGSSYDGKQGMSLATGVERGTSDRTTGEGGAVKGDGEVGGGPEASGTAASQPANASGGGQAQTRFLSP